MTSARPFTFDTVLVANRGEIASRVIRTARRMALRTVAVYSTADRGAPHVKAADVGVCIGPPEARDSYLNVDRILQAARDTGAQAIHPGYGFLSERSSFARACEEAGLVFVGPSASAIAAMGAKAAAKQRMRAVGVPVVAGYEGEQDDATLIEEAERIGFPVMVKASAGGGGKGMRLVTNLRELPSALASARREAASAFGSDELLLERAVLSPRHVEIQVLADRYGHTIHLGERDCSIQRRHQKVVEEAPSPAVGAKLRTEMGSAAIAAARSVDYVGAGTVEFLLDGDGSFFFLEMNTRLQVEHAVTELVTGIDIVEWQLRIARGEHLSIRQEGVRARGHAIEARLYAEDPSRGYLPSTGRIHAWRPPRGDGVRVDSGVECGTEITSHYDPMIAKIVSHGDDREHARRRLIRALQETTVLGPRTNRGMLLAVLNSAEFASGQATTAYLESMSFASTASTAEVATIAAWRYVAARAVAEARSPGLAGWSSSGRLRSGQDLAVGTGRFRIWIVEVGSALEVRVDDTVHHVEVAEGSLVVDGIECRPSGITSGAGRSLVALPTLDAEVLDHFAIEATDEAASGSGTLLAPMHGKVIEVDVAIGQVVVKGQKLATIEAMKMEHAVVADCDGVVTEAVALGMQVAAGHVLMRIEPQS